MDFIKWLAIGGGVLWLGPKVLRSAASNPERLRSTATLLDETRSGIVSASKKLARETAKRSQALIADLQKRDAARKKSNLGGLGSSDDVHDRHALHDRVKAHHRYVAAKHAAQKGQCGPALTNLIRASEDFGAAIANDVHGTAHLAGRTNIGATKKAAIATYSRNCKVTKSRRKGNR